MKEIAKVILILIIFTVIDVSYSISYNKQQADIISLIDETATLKSEISDIEQCTDGYTAKIAAQAGEISELKAKIEELSEKYENATYIDEENVLTMIRLVCPVCYRKTNIYKSVSEVDRAWKRGEILRREDYEDE